MLPDIYHITHIRNLPSIIEVGGLFAKNRLKRDYTNIANNEIQHNRTYTSIPCASGGTLHDYVPFYFAPRSPMLYAVNGGREYTGYQNNILHLVVDTEAIDESISFAFTDGHAAMRYSSFFDNWGDLDEIDWEVVGSWSWGYRPEDGDRTRRKQAEFLIYQYCPWEMVSAIGVINQTIKNQVQEILQNVAHQPPIKIQLNWYYNKT